VISFVAVSAGGKKKLFRLTDVVEIVPMLALSEVAEQTGACRGVANIRGEIVPVFDLTSPTAPLLPSRFIIVTRVGGAPTGLLVDDVHDVVTVPKERVTSVPVGGGRSATMVTLRDDDGGGDDILLYVIDPAEAMAHAR
jgi:chemotaxis signal transduction protein